MMNKLYLYLVSVLAIISAYVAHIQLVKRKTLAKYKKKQYQEQLELKLEKTKQARQIDKDVEQLTKEQKHEELESLIRDTNK